MSKKVKITRNGNLLEVLGPEDLISSLIEQLTYFKRVPTEGAERRHSKFKYIKTAIYQKVTGGLVTPAGFTKRICDAVVEAKLEYNYVDLRKKKWEKPDFTKISDVVFRVGQEEMLLKVCSNDCGVINAPTALGKTEFITWLCRIYSKSNIVIVAQQTAIVKAIYARLDKVIRDVGIVGAGYNCPDRVTVSTARSLKKAPLDKCDILLYDEVHTAAAEETQIALAAVRNARKFGFSASPRGRHDLADLETEALFGQEICKIEYNEAVEAKAIADIHVYMVDVTSGFADFNDLVSKERYGIWRNEARNKLIADIASSVPEDEQLLIMVSKIEHGLLIKKLLPDFPFIYGGMDSDQETDFTTAGLYTEELKLSNADKDDLRVKFENGELKRAIATTVWNTGLDFRYLNWLIRADAGSGVIGNIQISGRLSRNNNKEVGYLIDFYDKFDPGLMARSRSRLKLYTEKDWKITFVSNYKNISGLVK